MTSAPRRSSACRRAALLRAWGYAQAAELAASRGKRERAVELLSEAATEAAAVESNRASASRRFVVVAKAGAM